MCHSSDHVRSSQQLRGIHVKNGNRVRVMTRMTHERTEFGFRCRNAEAESTSGCTDRCSRACTDRLAELAS